MGSKSKFSKYITSTLILIVSLVLILAMCSYAISYVKTAREEQIVDVRKRDFEVVWNILETFKGQANNQIEVVAKNIEQEIYNNFDMDTLKQKLDEDDPVYTEKLYNTISKCVQDVHLNGSKNNRNSVIVLEGYNTIIEDKLIDPDAREDSYTVDDTNTDIYKYRDTTYNKKMFNSAMRKIRNHTDSSLIAIEPYNYISDTVNHTLIEEATYDTLEKIYIEEGFTGLRNYQFLVPVYITDTGDIFGQTDTLHGIRVDNHKFIVIQTFNLYEQLIAVKPDFGDDDYLHRLNIRYNNILNILNITGIVICMLIIFIVLYFISIYNTLLSKETQIVQILKELDNNTEDKNT